MLVIVTWQRSSSARNSTHARDHHRLQRHWQALQQRNCKQWRTIVMLGMRMFVVVIWGVEKRNSQVILLRLARFSYCDTNSTPNEAKWLVNLVFRLLISLLIRIQNSGLPTKRVQRHPKRIEVEFNPSVHFAFTHWYDYIYVSFMRTAQVDYRPYGIFYITSISIINTVGYQWT